jgi:hypothetical protein
MNKLGGSFVVILAMIFSVSLLHAADAQKTEAAKPDSAAAYGKETVVTGKILKVDMENNEFVLKEKKGEMTITVTPAVYDIKKLKKGEMVKVELVAGTNKADSIKVMKGKKKTVKKEMKKEAMPEEKKAE